MRGYLLAGIVLCAAPAFTQTITADISAVQTGPARVSTTGNLLQVDWPDERNRTWTAQFNLDSHKPLISSISVGGKAVVSGAQQFYQSQTGRRRGGGTPFSISHLALRKARVPLSENSTPNQLELKPLAIEWKSPSMECISGFSMVRSATCFIQGAGSWNNRPSSRRKRKM